MPAGLVIFRINSMFARIIGKIKRRENKFYDFLYRLAWNTKTFNVPKINFIHLPLYYVYISCSRAWHYFLQKLFYEPMFKAKCVECGPGLRILHGMPLISDNLRLYIGRDVCINGINTFSTNSVYDDPILAIGDNASIGYECVISIGKKVSIGKKGDIVGIKIDNLVRKKDKIFLII